jgi:hypothetical protein
MPITVAPKANAAVTITVEDPYTFDEWLAATTPLLNLGPGLQVLVDRSRSTPPTREFIERMVTFFERHGAQIKRWRAAIVAGTEAGYGVARMLELSAEARNIDLQIRAFRDLGSAQRWLTTGDA